MSPAINFNGDWRWINPGTFRSCEVTHLPVDMGDFSGRNWSAEMEFVDGRYSGHVTVRLHGKEARWRVDKTGRHHALHQCGPKQLKPGRGGSVARYIEQYVFNHYATFELLMQ